jgi:hypothetical protein
VASGRITPTEPLPPPLAAVDPDADCAEDWTAEDWAADDWVPDDAEDGADGEPGADEAAEEVAGVDELLPPPLLLLHADVTSSVAAASAAKASERFPISVPSRPVDVSDEHQSARGCDVLIGSTPGRASIVVDANILPAGLSRQWAAATNCGHRRNDLVTVPTAGVRVHVAMSGSSPPVAGSPPPG